MCEKVSFVSAHPSTSITRYHAAFYVTLPSSHRSPRLYHLQDESTGTSKRIKVESFPVASQLVNELMTRVLSAVSTSHILKSKLFQANFHTTLTGQSMITLIYHTRLTEEWEKAAKELRQSLKDTPGASSLPQIIGRSRKQKINLDKDEIEEVLHVANRGDLHYIQMEGSFSQPNAGICTSMLSWAVDVTSSSTDHDLLELYCGNGNFTAAIAPNFRKVVATEISKPSVAAARRNFEKNNVDNVYVARMSSEEFTEAWHSGRKFNRLHEIDLKSYSFKTLLVDPPRAGLDDKTVKLLNEFERVVYISCNPDTLYRDLSAVKDQFSIERFAIFDQFPYTHHVECGVYLKKKDAESESGKKREFSEVGADAANDAALKKEKTID